MVAKKTQFTFSIKFWVALLLTVILLLPTGTTQVAIQAASDGFHVSGTTIYDANGNPFEMRGVNIPHAWFSNYTKTSIQGAAALGANTVRIVLANGQQWNKTSYSEVSDIINWCKENNLICILEVHDATGDDNTASLNSAVDYWIGIKDLLNANTAYVIVNIANEWYGSWNGSAWADGYKTAIRTLRNAGIKNMLMVDSAGWGQYPDSIKNYGKQVFNADSHANTIFSIHMYEYAGGNASTVKTNIDNALSIGVPVVIGEFGSYHSNGDVDEYTIMSYCEAKNVGYLGWSWKGNGSGLEYLDIVNNWDGSSLTSWGNTLFYDTNGIKNTSSICTVYGGNSSGNHSGNGSSSDSSSTADYVSLFYGSADASNWSQAVSSYTTRAGGNFDASNIKSGGHFYVEYTGTQNKLELILQSWSGGANWGKVSISESGTANGNYYAKFSYDNCVAAFGSNNFSGLLDAIHVGAQDKDVTVISVCYDFGD